MEAAAEFFWSLRSGRPAPGSIPEYATPASLADAYRAQDILVRYILSASESGGVPIGYKIACTNAVAKELLRTDAPVFGRLLSSHAWPDGAVLPASRFPMVAAEPEFAFRMARNVPAVAGAAWDRESVAPFVGEMMPAIEIVGHSFEDWSVYSGPTLVADNAVSQGWVYGKPTEFWRDTDLARQEVSLHVNGSQYQTGSGANVLGHPLCAIAWLAQILPEYGLGLREGDLVTTGVCTDIHTSGPGESLVADFGRLGSVAVRFVE